MAGEITSVEQLLAEMAAEADKLGLYYTGDPDVLTEPVDAIDAMLTAMDIDPRETSRERRLKEFPPISLPHEYTETNDQPEDPEEWDQAQDTLNFFVYDLRNNPRDKEFEMELRGFLSDEDYSYSAQTIVRMLELALKSYK